MSRPIYTDPVACLLFAFVPYLAAAAGAAFFVCLAAAAAGEGWKAARRTIDRRTARLDREFAGRCTARLRALRGAPRSTWRKALRELALEREAIELQRVWLSDTPNAEARRAKARARRDAAWRAWFEALAREVGGADAALLARNPVRRGAPIRRLCERTAHEPPSPSALRRQYAAARGRGRVEDKIRLGSMLLDAEASVDSSLIRDEMGEIVGRRAGLRGWIRENCPDLLVHYGVLLGYRRLAAAVREEQGLGDPCPASLLLGEEPETERRLPPRQRAVLSEARRRVRKRLADPAAATVKAFAAGIVRRPAEPRDRMRRLA